ncbi:MAG TPA: hypothetical protein VHE30_28205 [Polyangiaceae bacterium]|nr:hypothetical protein [Polyangiaceae bacterium]
MSRAHALALSLLASACHGERDQAVRSEAGRVAEAVRKLREADGAAKRPLLVALEHETCTAEDVCALRKTCADAYTLQVTALESVAAVRHANEDGKPLPPEAMALLAEASAKLEASNAATKTCADVEGAARRKHGL